MRQTPALKSANRAPFCLLHLSTILGPLTHPWLPHPITVVWREGNGWGGGRNLCMCSETRGHPNPPHLHRGLTASKWVYGEPVVANVARPHSGGQWDGCEECGGGWRVGGGGWVVRTRWWGGGMGRGWVGTGQGFAWRWIGVNDRFKNSNVFATNGTCDNIR